MLGTAVDLIDYVGIANSNVLPKNATTFKQLSVMEDVEIPEQKPDIEQIIQASVSIKILNVRVVETPVGTAPDGQTLTGYKAIVEALLCQKIEYVADEETQSVHSAHFAKPFSSFIVLPATFNPNTQPLPKVTGYIEDIFVYQLDKRNIFKNITVLLDISSFC
ncbi:DUF3794 domain-containing protein [Inediibacterium massiliense]|uniref:DUF3794 domain-containing protein n=1 Tax=Inediibacterium massiliense TaxID=1658111 RepID=UPI0006B4E767|nr:DUF3794 domain-containing protein [Inediibacterium massiliense]